MPSRLENDNSLDGMSDTEAEISEVIRLFLDKTRHGMAIVKDTKIIYANPKVLEYTGFSLEELRGMDFWELTDEEHMEEVLEAAARLLKDPDTEQPIEIPVFRKDGETRILRIDADLVNLEGIQYLLITALDISEMKRIQENLSLSEKKLDLAYRGANIAIWEWDLVNMRIEFDEKWSTLLGYEPGEREFTSETWKDSIHPDDVEEFNRRKSDHLEGRSENFTVEYRLRCKDGSWKWFLDLGQIQEWDENGKPLYISGIHMDVTEKNRALLNLKGSEQKYMAVLEHSPNNIYLVDQETMRIIESNTTLQDLLGYSGEELKGMTPYDFIDHSKDDVNIKIEELPSRQYGFVGPRIYRTKEGKTIDVEVSASLIEYNERNVISVVSWDVSTLKRAQEELIDLNEILRLIARITRHDIRNRLTIAFGILDMLRQGSTLDPILIEEAFKSVRKSIDITKRMNQLENLMVSGQEKKEISLRDTIEEILADFPLKYSIEGDSSVLVDSAFDSVVENIIGNAMFHGGADRMNVEIVEEDGNVLISFADNGKGIPEDIRDMVFEESFSFGENRGTGLGLYIVKKVVERYGGDVWIKDDVSHGTIFLMRIPKKPVNWNR